MVRKYHIYASYPVALKIEKMVALRQCIGQAEKIIFHQRNSIIYLSFIGTRQEILSLQVKEN